MILEESLVKEWMSSPVVSVTSDETLSRAHQLMKEKDIRRLPVVDKNDHLIGIITIGDVREARPSDATTLSIWELNYLWAQLTVGKIMSENVVTVHENTSVVNVAELMLEKKISGLPVVNDENELVGIITESDIFRLVVRSRKFNIPEN